MIKFWLKIFQSLPDFLWTGSYFERVGNAASEEVCEPILLVFPQV